MVALWHDAGGFSGCFFAWRPSQHWQCLPQPMNLRGQTLNKFLASTLRRVGLVFGVAASMLFSGCASVDGKFPPAPASATSGDYSYIIGAGDSLNIMVWRNPELSMVVPVRPDGKVAAPLIDEMVVQGKNSVAVAREIEAQLGKYVRDPVVTVIVTSFVGPYSEQIRVIGEAARPQALPFKQKMTVLDVMIAVGGLTDFAAGNEATILRSSEGAGKQYSVRLKDLIKRGDVSANVEMRPGDVLIIPQSLF
jgi:polysaccharide export outer membrane protein